MELANDSSSSSATLSAEAATAENNGINPVVVNNNDDMSSSKNKATTTPRDDNSNTTCPTMVTAEKKMTLSDPQKSLAEKKNNNDYASSNSSCRRQYASSFSITCPDGTLVHLSAPPPSDDDDCSPQTDHDDILKNNDDKVTMTTSQIILGRGKYGIPSSASHVSRQACVLRMILEENEDHNNNATTTTSDNNNAKQYALELVVLGSQPCRITRHQSSSSSSNEEGAEKKKQSFKKTIFARSISQIITNNSNGKDDFSPSSTKIWNGDVIEPYDRPMECHLEDAIEKGCYHPFTVSFGSKKQPLSTESVVVGGELEQEKTNSIDIEAETAATTTAAAAAAFTEALRKIEAAAVQMDETKKKTIENVGVAAAEEDPSRKENSQDTVDVQSVMLTTVETDVEMKAASEGNNVGSVDLVKSADEKNDEEKLSIHVEGEKVEEMMTTNAIICTSDSMSSKSDKKSVDNANAVVGMDCSSNHMKEEAGEEEGTVKATDVNLPPTETAMPSISTTENLKESPADTPNERESSSSPSSEEESSEEEYEFDDPRQEIIDILQEIDAPGTFAVGGSCDGKLIMPGLVVDGVGPIGLPLSTSQAKELVNRCEQAPFGRGAKTIVDKSVRDTFQLAPEFFQITNPTWKKDLDTITDSVCQKLGVQANLKVEARLYKLLLYEEGSFFAPHRDSEKEEGMFGTLVIVLPSQFTGGELVVKHKGETETFKQEGSSSFGSQYAAFYADCKHELKKVTSGHRLCIVYNLVKVGLGMLPRVADNSSLLKRLNAAASHWAAEYDGRKIVLMTDHLYTPAGIKNGTGSAKYKGSDAYVAELLQSAINKGADIEYDHGTLSLSESGYAEEDYGYGWGRYGSGSFTWAETTDRDLSLYLSSYGNVSIDDEEEVIPENFFEDMEPDDETFEPTGNAGVQAERQYADTEAIVVWPRSKRWMIVTNNNTSRMCSYLVKACSKGTPDSEPKDECMQKAKSLIPRVVGSSKADVSALVRSIVMIGDNSLAEEFLSSYLKVSERSFEAIFDHIQAFMELCGAEVINSLIVDSISTTRFAADPTGTANFVLKYLENFAKKVAISQQQRDNVIAVLVDSICPPYKSNFRAPKTSLDKFPLSAMLTLFIDKKPDNGTLARRVLEGYVWISCQQVKQSYSYSYSKQSNGPVLLTSATVSIIQLCESFGWAEYKDVLVDAVENLCERGKSDIALALVESLAPKDKDKSSDRSDVCSKLASVACGKILASLRAPANKSTMLGVCKNLVVSIGRFCPSKALEFVEVAKSLDFDSVLFPLVSDATLRSNACDCVINSLDLLTRHCSHVLDSRVSAELGYVTVWSLPNASLSRNSTYSSFLRSPCQQELDWQVRKSDHPGFMADLRELIRSGDVKAVSYQPGGRGAYRFKITKLKPRRVLISSLGGFQCSCSSSSSYSRYSSYRYQPSTCLLSKHKATASKYQDDLKKMNVIKSLLPSVPAVAVAVQRQQGQLKQPATQRLQQFDVLYTTPKLGLNMSLMNGKDVAVKGVTPAAPNANMIKAGDFIVGINGKRFEELGVKVEGKDSFAQAMDKLREAKRPMSVMFERWITTNNDEVTTRKRPAATDSTSSAVAVGGEASVGADAQIQHSTVKKAKAGHGREAAEIIDLT